MFNPATGDRGGAVPLAAARRRSPPRLRAAADAFEEWRERLALAAERGALPLPRPGRRAQRRPRAHHRAGARQGALRRAGRGAARPRRGRVRLRHPPAAQGPDLRERLDRRRHLVAAAAARRRGGHHPVQLSRDGAALDVPDGHRLREHLRAQAVGEGSVRVGLPGAALRPGRTAGGRA